MHPLRMHALPWMDALLQKIGSQQAGGTHPTGMHTCSHIAGSLKLTARFTKQLAPLGEEGPNTGTNTGTDTGTDISDRHGD